MTPSQPELLVISNEKNTSLSIISQTRCAHCGDPCLPKKEKKPSFCCEGCQTVYQLLEKNNLCAYYSSADLALISLKNKENLHFEYLDDDELQQKILFYRSPNVSRVRFDLPTIHCAACIWLLENLPRLHEGILSSTVHFIEKEIHISFKESVISIRQLAELLDKIGYPPLIRLDKAQKKQSSRLSNDLIYQIGVAGFAFGNSMLFSFPEYLGLTRDSDPTIVLVLGYLNLSLGIPVLFYSARDYFISAWKGLKIRDYNLDIPIVVGATTLFVRSAYEIISQSGSGYMDSLAGFLFFLLAGKWFQERTYKQIAFDRDYQSYFPIATTIITAEGLENISLPKLKKGDEILLKNGDLIPADGLLNCASAAIDYSFVSGEAALIPVIKGEKVYAGGKWNGKEGSVLLSESVSQSYLTQLWNDPAFHKEGNNVRVQLTGQISKYFTFSLFTIAILTLIYWYSIDKSMALNAFTAVLIVACPCAVALSVPFTYGNVLRILGKKHFFIKNVAAVESISNIDTFVFDKTGTITSSQIQQSNYVGKKLSDYERNLILNLSSSSTHPVSKTIFTFFKVADFKPLNMTGWEEKTGFGLQAEIDSHQIKIGSSKWIDVPKEDQEKGNVFIEIDRTYMGYLSYQRTWREGAASFMEWAKNKGKTYILSGDNDNEKENLSQYFKISIDNMFFKQTPTDKLAFIKALQLKGQKVFMLGDGLNDAGALRQSNFGMVISENQNNFTPASDAILAASKLDKLAAYLSYAIESKKWVYLAYGFALIYNIIGLYFAVQGTLSPVVAAILMPTSSITVVIWGLSSTSFFARKL
jgi:Cu+-exporting ATPase